MSDHHKEPFKLHSPEFDRLNKGWDRRNFLTKTSLGLGAIALGSLIGKSVIGRVANTLSTESASATLEQEILRALPHFAPKYFFLTHSLLPYFFFFFRFSIVWIWRLEQCSNRCFQYCSSESQVWVWNYYPSWKHP